MEIIQKGNTLAGNEAPAINRGERKVAFDEKTVRIKTILDQDETKDTFELIESGFTALNTASILKQDMSYEELEADAKNAKTVKFLLYEAGESEKDQLTGFISVMTDPQQIPWMDIDKVGKMIDTTEEDVVYAVGTIVIDPESRGLKSIRTLLEAAGKWTQEETDRLKAEGKRLNILFDFAPQNEKLPQLLSFMFRELLSEPEISCIGQEKTYVFDAEAIQELIDGMEATGLSTPGDTSASSEDTSDLSMTYFEQNGIDTSELRVIKVRSSQTELQESDILQALKDHLPQSEADAEPKVVVVRTPLRAPDVEYPLLDSAARDSSDQSLWIGRVGA